ncbi:recombinase family protein [uncultured Fusobacterium sp.]|uniref:recombinase family protein n=1 Tax=uncultured Fusobacterium sp. TaxID=159267 RepID=UPI002804B04B|nr:recombinase family protein [uncultured Fusobacterium sp.]
MKYGYIRVSTKEQDETRQIEALRKAGILEKNIYIDKSTGTTFAGREAWQQLLAKVVVGDTITIKELDRLGRNNKEVKETFELISKKGVFLEFLEQPLLNTYGKSEIERELLQPLILHLLGYFAEKENEKRKTRQAEAYAALPRDGKGRILSRKKNKVVGRPNALDNLTGEQKRLITLCSRREITIEECMNLTKFSRSTIYKLRKNLFPDSINNKELSSNYEEVLRKWKNKEISTGDCIRLTGYSRTYLYKLLEKNGI